MGAFPRILRIVFVGLCFNSSTGLGFRSLWLWSEYPDKLRQLAVADFEACLGQLHPNPTCRPEDSAGTLSSLVSIANLLAKGRPLEIPFKEPDY